MIKLGQLAKLATGTISPDDLRELVSGLGIDVTVNDVNEEHKADAFQRVAQFSLVEDAQVKHLSILTSDGIRLEAVVVIRSLDQSNRRPKKVVDILPDTALSSA